MAARLTGKVAVVTGGTRGIGLAIARAMLAEGADVMIASRKADGVTTALATLEAARASAGDAAAGWGRAVGEPCHVGDPAACIALMQAAEAQLGTVDTLVNNAGTNPFFGPLTAIDEVAFDKTFEVNLKPAWRLSVLLAKRLAAAKRPGAIINTASILGERAAPFQGVYGMTKAALISLTQTLAVELAGQKIRVNAILPGLVETKLAAAITGNPALVGSFMNHTALRRPAQPGEIAGLAVFLASDEASYITGAAVPVDGGYLAM